MAAVFSTLLAYFIGGINPAYILARFRGFDIRRVGSRNAGASNALMLLGKGRGIFVMLFDIAKAYGAVQLAGLIAANFLWCRELAASAVVIGHVFPAYMRFRGGKGLSCLGGVVLALSPRLFLLLFLAELVVLFSTRYLCFVSISGSILFPILYAWGKGDWLCWLFLLPVSAVISCKHWVNLRRIRAGEEARISILWNRSKELERLNQGAETDDKQKE